MRLAESRGIFQRQSLSKVQEIALEFMVLREAYQKTRHLVVDQSAKQSKVEEITDENFDDDDEDVIYQMPQDFTAEDAQDVLRMMGNGGTITMPDLEG